MSSDPLNHDELLNEAYIISKALKLNEDTKVFFAGNLRPIATSTLAKLCTVVNKAKDADCVILGGPYKADEFIKGLALHKLAKETKNKKCLAYYMPNEMSKFYKNDALPFDKVLLNPKFHFLVATLP